MTGQIRVHLDGTLEDASSYNDGAPLSMVVGNEKREKAWLKKNLNKIIERMDTNSLRDHWSWPDGVYRNETPPRMSPNRWQKERDKRK